MAPFSWTTCVSCWAKSVSSVCSSALARCTSVLPPPYVVPVKHLTSQPSGPPKRPLTGFIRYFLQQQPILPKRYQEIKMVDVTKMIAQEWRTMSPEQKQPFKNASLQAMAQFKVDLQRYQALLTPAQLQQQAQEKKQRLAKKKASRKRRELTSLGIPKRSRSPFNIYMSDHFEEASGATPPEKLKSLAQSWKNLFSHQKKVYIQLSEDDKIRYKNEMKAWQDHMLEIGRGDLVLERSASTRKNKPAAKKGVKLAKTKKGSSTGKSKTAKKKKTGRSVKKTV
ncbi:transcription factor A, mitochondrial [Antennarius striatus]|uniref:transcription factor A, mitochondrial n=1 Tax=Antennarius striatus TaxID=241820 RepID=UPI0035B1FBE6